MGFRSRTASRSLATAAWMATIPWVLSGCGDSTSPPQPARIDVTTGMNQVGEVGQPLPSPVGFVVRDPEDRPIPGVSVTLTVSRGGGTVPSSGVTTGPDGTVQTVWTLGTDASESQELTARAASVTGVAFATARAGPASSVEAVSGGAQTGLAGEPLPDPLTVRVLDQFGNPVGGAEVSWAVEDEGGTISPSLTQSGADGTAQAEWTLGLHAGTYEASGRAGEDAVAPFQAFALPNGVVEGEVAFSSALLSARADPGFEQLARTGSPAADEGIRSGAGPLASYSGSGDALRPLTGEHPALSGLVPGQWTIRIRDEELDRPPLGVRLSADQASSIAARVGAALSTIAGEAPGRLEVLGISPVLGVARVRIAPADQEEVLALVRRDPRVAWVEPVRLVHAMDRYPGVRLGRIPVAEVAPLAGGTSPSPFTDFFFFPRQSWHYGMIDVPRAWNVTEGGAEVIVAVVDDGIRFDHPSVAPNLTSDGFDFVSDVSVPRCGGGTVSNAGDGDGPDPDPTIPSSFLFHPTFPCVLGPQETGGHGLHVAGTVAAAAAGVVGVAPRTRVRPVRVLGVTGAGLSYDVAQGILYAAGLPADGGTHGLVQPPDGAQIMNLSLGGPTFSSVVAEAVEAAAAAGTLIVAAAGNAGTTVPQFPAALTETLSVSSVGPDFALAPYSSRGNSIDLAAPGGNLFFGAAVGGIWSSYWRFSTSQPLIAALQGTSMAAPHVAGVASLLLATQPGMSAGALRAQLTSTALDLGPPGRDPSFGHGLVDALSALTDGRGFPGALHLHLYDAESGARESVRLDGTDLAFRFSGLNDGSYVVYAGLDDREDGVTGRPPLLWGARGGTPTPQAIAIDGHAVHDGSLTIGFPTEAEPNDTMGDANPLPLGGYMHGIVAFPGDADHFRVLIPEGGSYVVETGGWYGMCGWGLEADTALDLFDSTGSLVASNSHMDESAERFCSRISVSLAPGAYVLRVTAGGNGIGLYTIRAFAGSG